VLVLKQIITTSIDKQQLFSATAMRQLLSTAVNEFSKDIFAKFDFMDIYKPYHSNHDYANILLKYFIAARTYYIFENFPDTAPEFPLSCAQDVFEYAAARLSDRLLDFHNHFVLRNKTPEADIPSIAKRLVTEVDALIRDWIPCTATKYFKEVGATVRCDCLSQYHSKGHQSFQTYYTKTSLLDKVLSVSTVTVKHPELAVQGILQGTTSISSPSSIYSYKPYSCRWKGQFQTHDKYTHVGWFVDQTKLENASILTAVGFLQNHKRVLESQMKLLQKLHAKEHMCLGCLMNFTDEVLQCSHVLCSSCCKELLVNGSIECPFCTQQCKWKYKDIPDGAGYRVLSMAAMCENTLLPALLLQKIEDQIGIPVHQLFDLIVGMDAAALSAIGYGILRMPAKQAIVACQKVLENKTYDAIARYIYF
jgi:hypothetical protein